MKKSIVLGLIILLMVSIFIPVISNAEFSFSDTISDLDTKADTKAAGSDGEIASARRVVKAVLQITRIVAAGVAIIMLTVLAIKYISAAPGDKADIKKHAVVYIVGAVVLFASSAILGIIEDFADNNIN